MYDDIPESDECIRCLTMMTPPVLLLRQVSYWAAYVIVFTTDLEARAFVLTCLIELAQVRSCKVAGVGEEKDRSRIVVVTVVVVLVVMEVEVVLVVV